MQEISPSAYGIAAFAIIEKLLIRLVENKVLSQSETLAILDQVARRETARGLTHNSDWETAAAELASNLAIAIRRHPS